MSLSPDLKALLELVDGVVNLNRHWWEQQVKHRHYLTRHDLAHRLNVIDDTLTAIKSFKEKNS